MKTKQVYIASGSRRKLRNTTYTRSPYVRRRDRIGAEMVTPRERELERERTLGELIEAAKRASLDREEIKRKLDAQDTRCDEIFEKQDDRCREILAAIAKQRTDHLRMEDELKNVLSLADRVGLVERRQSEMSADIQAFSSLSNIIRRYSWRILLYSLLALIAGLSAGFVGVGKVVGLFINAFMKGE